MPNPFDAADERFIVLTNDEGQHSLWPHFAHVPAGWTVVHDTTDRASCLAYIRANWTDIRPRSLRQQLGQTDMTPAHKE